MLTNAERSGYSESLVLRTAMECMGAVADTARTARGAGEDGYCAVWGTSSSVPSDSRRNSFIGAAGFYGWWCGGVMVLAVGFGVSGLR
ncbi:hypothetical protein JOF35_008767 [Streptomyces demainii]|uniref:Uncharacterized protein n=1 Tax=Streptomyces demainii TaxID=588122 RepID=A0ABT9L6S8_9ACTN|nr:hypothetical protein [Streptomyces demainii]